MKKTKDAYILSVLHSCINEGQISSWLNWIKNISLKDSIYKKYQNIGNKFLTEIQREQKDE